MFDSGLFLRLIVFGPDGNSPPLVYVYIHTILLDKNFLLIYSI